MLTGLIGAPLVILVIGLGQRIGLLSIILAATIQGLIEFYKLTSPHMRSWERHTAIGLGTLFPIAAYFGQGEMLLPTMGGTLFVLFLLFILAPEGLSATASRMGVMLLGIVYVAFFLSHMVLLMNLPTGNEWVLFVIIIVWAGDTAAYFTGTRIGKHKLCPKISPKKSFEGLFGGVAGSVIVAVVFPIFFLRHLTTGHAALLACLITILGQTGDFAESMIKRSVSAKDSSGLIPGHGGLLDRLDSFLFSVPFLYYYVFVTS